MGEDRPPLRDLLSGANNSAAAALAEPSMIDVLVLIENPSTWRRASLTRL